jgi:hypothetical protein
MFGGGNKEYDEDITKELAVAQLIDKTETCDHNLWMKVDYNTYIQYYFEEDISQNQKIHFRLTHYLTHDSHTLNIYMSKRRGSTMVSVVVVLGGLVLPLIKTIERTKKYYYPGGK